MSYFPSSIFITGASSGIGKSLATGYAQKGVTLFLCGRNKARLEKVALLCKQKKATVYAYAFDVTDEKATKQAIEKANKIQPLELLIANAGIAASGIKDFASETRQLFNTNIGGVVNTVLPAVEIFKKQGGGQIAITSSLAGYRALPSCPAYSATKACVRVWGESLSLALEPYNIAVSVISPGFVKTPLTDKNNFIMPFKISAPKASAFIRKKLAKGASTIAFPYPMRFGVWFASLFPTWFIRPFLKILPKKES